MTSNYSLRNVLTQSPAAVSGAVGSILTTVALAGWSPLDDKTNLAIVGSIGTVLALFYIGQLTTSNARMQDVQNAVDDAHAAGFAQALPLHSQDAIRETAQATADAIAQTLPRADPIPVVETTPPAPEPGT